MPSIISSWVRNSPERVLTSSAEILYERLVTEDKVDLLMGPLGAGPAGFAVAQKYKARFRPCCAASRPSALPHVQKVVMNSGDFTYDSASPPRPPLL